jgi:hypothetical protein
MNGHGKMFLTEGRIFIGELIEFKMIEGKLCEMQKDKNYAYYQVKYQKSNDKYLMPSS